MNSKRLCALFAATTLVLAGALAIAPLAPAQEQPPESPPEHSIAREWNDLLLEAIRDDLARPTVHARNLFHASVAMWDAWAAYDPGAATYLHHEKAASSDVAAARHEALSYAVYRVLSARFARSPGADTSLPAFDAKMQELGYDPATTATDGDSPAALGNRIGATVLAFGAADGANEDGDYGNLFYEPVNPSLLPAFAGNPDIVDANRWQPLALEFFVDQSGNAFPTGEPEFLGPEWGAVTPFALSAEDRTTFRRKGSEYVVYHDPGPPPLLGGVGDDEYRAGFTQVVEWSSLLDPADGETIDISPAARGNNTLGTNDGHGRAVNPATGAPYAEQLVPAGDYYRVLAEFWADGPDSETPPGHWFVIANYVTDQTTTRRIAGEGSAVDALEWDVKLYFTLGGAMHDAAVTAWGVKGWYDYIRPISAIRHMAGLGQSTDPDGPGYHVDGIPLVPGVIEVITPETVTPGGRHYHLAGPPNASVGKIAFRAWRGPDYILDPDVDTAGVGWILSDHWWPYQRPSFVTPPFAGYVSGHSTFSRAAAEVLTAFTGDPYFPGGMGEFVAPKNEFLVFEEGPSQSITLQWATYFDAADECSLSRIYGGIHPRADDLPGRRMGAEIGPDAVAKAQSYFAPAETVAITHAAAEPRRRGRGRVLVRGVLPSSIDATQGISVTIGYDGDRAETATLPRERCRTRKSGRVFGRTRDRSFKFDCRRSNKVPGEYRFVVKLKVDEHGEPGVQPLTIQIRDGVSVRVGRIETARREGGRRPRIVWD